MNSLITPTMIERHRKMPLSGLTADIERGRGLIGGNIFTATIWRRKRKPIVVVMPTRGELEAELSAIDRIYQKR